MVKRPYIQARLKAIAAREGIPWDDITIYGVSPDSCPCAYLEWHRDSEANAVGVEQIPGFEQMGRVCPAHADVPPDETLWRMLIEENTRKNIALGLVRSQGGGEVVWAYDHDPARTPRAILHLIIARDDAAAFQGMLDAQVGPGRIVIDR
jgi:hypothetical protein